MALIINKTKPCNCGCNGTDPWHKSTYKRSVTQTSDTTGTVKLPYSSNPVVVTREAFDVNGVTVYGPWIVYRDSIV